MQDSKRKDHAKLYLNKGEQITSSIFSPSPDFFTCSLRRSTYYKFIIWVKNFLMEHGSI